jgi:tripartite-type tricarboxylate transporter receptor subunit TctC
MTQTMSYFRNTFIFLSGSVLLSGATAVQAAETYPTRPIRLIVPLTAGGPTDILARIGSACSPRIWSSNR